ncbi:MAG: hypothetical protein F4X64_19020 [Chloroflexi bacterium]|nr:hypothetical protein [Chloroflexota bacterium]
MTVKLRSAKDEIGRFCQRHSVRRLTWLHEPVRAGSEAAFLVEFLREDLPPLATLAAMEADITEILDRPTDLHLYIRGFYVGNIPDEGKIAYDRADYMEFPIPKDKIADFCQRHEITRLASIKYPWRNSVINDSDLDFIAEFAPDAKLGLAYFGLGEELTELLGYPADLRQVDSVETWQEEGKSKGQSATVHYERRD